MNKLRPYLEEYIKNINALLSKHQNDDAILKAAEQHWVTEDPRYLVFLECGNYNPRMPQSPIDTAGGDQYRSNEISSSPPSTSK